MGVRLSSAVTVGLSSSELLRADAVLRKHQSSPSVPLPVGASQQPAQLPVAVFL